MSVEINVTDQIVEIEVAAGASVQPTWGAITGTLSNQTDLQNALNAKFDDPTGTTLQYLRGDGSLATFPLTLPVLQQVRNQSGTTMNAGEVVYINGATGNLPTIARAIANADATSAQTLGMVQTAIANNGTGYVVVLGTIGNLDTSAYTEGQQLYLSGSVAGGVTTTKQLAPIHLVYVGIVTRSHPNQGTIEVKVQNGYELDEIHDVQIISPTNGQVLKYNSATQLWQNSSDTDTGITSLNGLTALSQSFATGTSGTDFNISSATSTHTFNLPSASATNRGLLTSADWTTFNNKQNALTNPITGTGTSGQVAYFTGATTQSGSNNLFWDNTNARLGIGTNTPAHKLDVNGNIRIPNSSFIYINNSAATAIGALSIDAGDNTIINTSTGGDIYLRSAGNTIGRLLSTGDVNLGGTSATTTPIVKITSTGRLGVNNTAPTYTTDITGTLRSTTTTYLATSSGNVLVGSTTDNGFRLDVNGTMRVSGASTLTGAVSTTSTITSNTYVTAGTSASPVFSDTFNLGAAANLSKIQYGNEFSTSNGSYLRFIVNSASATNTPVNALTLSPSGAATFSSSVTSTQFRLSALNTAPATASSTGTLGEIRIDADYIYICTATNTWKRVAIATW